MVNLFANFLSRFREIFVPSHLSLEFRAKSFAAIIVANKNIKPESWDILNEISKEIYPDDKSRQAVLVQTTKEYTDLVLKNELSLDSLLRNISFLLKTHPRYAQKINFNRLRKFLDKNEEESLVQQRVIEFFEQEIHYIASKNI
ncbi:hypothetical protein [Campylobacter insulaenigrae]|uniref:Uncharacterized protein n=1 Tax=Campylobacter insulaenigrae TaxID=260714 RepID=A0ABY3G5R2_9BACT|nr:hypothetical protein [Campylobacter insulaenigrae]MCR6587925.1 hypothetical protein [Campylobacter insulaenigrae]TWO26549.1 hypothetical protein ZA01_03320 [Campylobacter insulaenigrae]